MSMVILFSYIFLAIAILALVVTIISIVKAKKCKFFDVTGMILAIVIATVCAHFVYLFPNRSITDFLKPTTTPEGMNWNFKTNPQICKEEVNNGKKYIQMCPVWIEDNIQVCLSYEEQLEYSAYSILMLFPKVTRNRNMHLSTAWDDRMYVRLDDESMIEPSCVTSIEENLGIYQFRAFDFERMANKGIISVAYRSPSGLGLWKRMGDEGLTAINEQLIYLVNYVDYVKNSKVEPVTAVLPAKNVSAESDPLYDKKKIAERAKVLIDYFHYYNLHESLESAFSKEYCRLYRHAHDIPSDNPQGMGSEESIGYAMAVGSFNGFDMCESHPKTIQSVEVIDEKTVKVKMNYFHDDHEMILILENGKWMVDDLNGSKKKAREYIKKQRAFFKSQEWEDYLQRWLIEGDSRYSDEELRTVIASCRKDVEDYFKKYPK